MPPQLENKRFSCGSLTSHKKIIAMILKLAHFSFFYYQALVVSDSQLQACSLTQLSDRCWLFFFWLWCVKIFFLFLHIPRMCSHRRVSGKENSATPRGIIYYSKRRLTAPHFSRDNMLYLSTSTGWQPVKINFGQDFKFEISAILP